MADDNLVLTVAEREKRDGIFDCYHDGRYLCSSPSPFLDGCRALLAQGHNSAAQVVMRQAGSTDDALSGILGHVAALQVGGDGVGFRPRPEPVTAPSVRFAGLPAITLGASC